MYPDDTVSSQRRSDSHHSTPDQGKYIHPFYANSAPKTVILVVYLGKKYCIQAFYSIPAPVNQCYGERMYPRPDPSSSEPMISSHVVWSRQNLQLSSKPVSQRVTIGRPCSEDIKCVCWWGWGSLGGHGHQKNC